MINRKIILLGAPGSGKGTISTILVNKYNFTHLSTGDMFRKIISKPITEHEIKIRNLISAGNLIDDNVTNQLLKNELEKITDKNSNVVFDGYPRTINQAQYLDNIQKIDNVFLVNINEDVIIKRITGRRTCPKCGAIYNIYFKKPKIENLCDRDNERLVQRKDDNESTIKNRLKVYFNLTNPLINFYKSQNKLVVLDGNKNLNDIVDLLIKYIK
jgi:adenylate kinase